MFKSIQHADKQAFVQKGKVVLSPRSPHELNKLKGILWGVDPGAVEVKLPFVP